jgi:hypothetical protein
VRGGLGLGFRLRADLHLLPFLMREAAEPSGSGPPASALAYGSPAARLVARAVPFLSRRRLVRAMRPVAGRILGVVGRVREHSGGVRARRRGRRA